MKIEFESEEELESVLCDCDHILNLIVSRYHSGVCSEKNVAFRQVNLREYGIPDVVFLYKYNGIERLIVIELKNVTAQVKDFAQLSRYLTCLKRLDTRFKITGGILIDVGEKRDKDVTFLYNELRNNILWGTVSCGVMGVKLEIHSKNWFIPDKGAEKLDLIEALNKSYNSH